MTLGFVSERVPRNGAITGAGLHNLMGAPGKDQLDIVVREAVQNSWDARSVRDGSIQFSLHYFDTTADQRAAYDRWLASACPSRDSFHDFSSGFVLADRGTRGLAGPTRADSTSGERSDFSNFVFMVGETKGTAEGAGGSYGYGRSSFFVLSASNTVLVHTRCLNRDVLESRFIGIAWTAGDIVDGERYTGRHWWGRQEDGGAAPVIGPEADRIARELGMPVPGDGETGTTILIINPQMGQREKGEPSILEEIEAQVLWNCWPHIEDETIDFRLSWNEELRSPLFSYQVDPRFRLLARAYRLAGLGEERQKNSGICRTIRNKRPKRAVGTLATTLGAFDPHSRRVVGGPGGDSPMRYVALMRGPRIIVEYFQCVEPSEGFEYAGVFLADPGVDEILRRSEPPAHDAWISNRLQRRSDKSAVNAVFNKSYAYVQEWLEPDDAQVEPSEQRPLGMLSEFLGEIVAGLSSDGGAPNKKAAGGGGKGGGGSRTPRVEILEVHRTADGVGARVEMSFRVLARSGASAERSLKARLGVAIDRGGREGAPPTRSSVPELIGWLDEGGQVIDAPVFSESDGYAGRLAYWQPSDCSVEIDIKVCDALGSAQ